MSINGLRWEKFTLPFAAGLDTKSDVRAMQPPGLLIAKDIVLDETGGVQLRKPLVALGSSINPSGTLSTVRRSYAYGDELIAFDKDTLYSWNANLSKWVSRGTHLAVKTDERPVFVTTGDQVECDRAELSNTVVYCWTDGGVYIAATDKETGSVLLSPSLVEASSSRGRLVVIEDKILLFFKDASGNLDVCVIDPSAPAGTSGTQVIAAANFNDYYDVCPSVGADLAFVAARRDTTTAYSVVAVDVDGATSFSATPARTCDGPIAIAAAPNGTHVQIIRANSGDIEGDYLLASDFSDVTTAQAVGTATAPLYAIAAAYRSTQDSGEYRCYAFWTGSQHPAALFQSRFNFVDTGGSLGTEATFVADLGVTSRAFEHDGHVYVNMAFGADAVTGAVLGVRAQLQNTNFLYRDDQHLVGKSVFGRGGGLLAYVGPPAVGTQGWIPGVQSLGSGVFAWCATERRVIPVGDNHSAYSARAPSDITFTFDSNEARRVALCGETLYVTGAEIRQYDGEKLTEVGFHVYPYSFTLATSASGNVEDGAYTIKPTWRCDNAKGERERSTTATALQTTVSSGPKKITISASRALRPTHKTGVVVEYWRTLKNPTADSPFYLVTGQDPTDTSGANCFVEMVDPDDASDLASFDDALADSTVETKENNPENGGVLESVCPPAATIIAATETRVFLAGVAGEPDNVWYSRHRGDGEIVSFNEALKVSVPKAGGAITALSFLNDTLVVFRERATYLVPGEGFDNLGGGSNYGPARSLSQDVGAVSAEAVALTPGGLIFKSHKGWYLLRGQSLDYIGAKVADYDSESVHAVHVVENNHHVRIVTSSRVLMFDYSMGEWAEWSISDAVHAVVWDGTWHDVAATGPRAEQTDYTNNADSMDVETAWIKPDDFFGAVSAKEIQILGEYRSACRVRVRIAYNYLDSTVDDKHWTPSPTTVGGPIQLIHGLARPKCTAFKVRLTVVATGSNDPPAGEGVKLTALGVEFGFRGRINQRLPAAQRQ